MTTSQEKRRRQPIGSWLDPSESVKVAVLQGSTEETFLLQLSQTLSEQIEIVPVALVSDVLLVIAPTTVAKTSLRNRIVGWAVPEFEGQVEIEHTGLSWFAPVRSENISIKDLAGQTAVEKFRSSKLIARYGS